MNKPLAALAIGITVFISGIAIGHRKPQTVTIRPPAVVIHDTVKTIDTVQLTKVIEKSHPDTVWVTKEIVSAPETVSVFPPFAAMTKLKAGRVVGDTGYAQVLAVSPLANGMYGFRQKHYQWISPGPLNSVIVDSASLRVSFYDPPPPPCTAKDDLKWMGIGAGGITLLRAVLGR